MHETIVIGGEVLLINALNGETTLLNVNDGDCGEFIAVDSHETYSGSYTVTPSAETQVLSTADMILTENVVVNPIPSNYGLITWNGSILTVS